MRETTKAGPHAAPFPHDAERHAPGNAPVAEGYPKATMICVDSGLDGLSGCFAVDEQGNWLGHDGEVVLYAGEDMAAAVARMRQRRP